jgi:hypothetical protein
MITKKPPSIVSDTIWKSTKTGTTHYRELIGEKILEGDTVSFRAYGRDENGPIDIDTVSRVYSDGVRLKRHSGLKTFDQCAKLKIINPAK